MRRAAATATGRLDRIGRDRAHDERIGRSARRGLTLLLAAALLGALGVAALRVDLIRVRYGLADAVCAEKALFEKRRQAVTRVRALRDPTRLGQLAKELGFVRPSHIGTLPVPQVRP